MKKLPFSIYPIAGVFLVFFVSVLASCSHSMKAGTATHGSNVIWIDNHKFSPSSITVPLNTTVTWTNKDRSAYTIASDNGRFQSGKLKKNDSFSNKFTAVGTYKYHCDGHADIKGEVIVQ